MTAVAHTTGAPPIEQAWKLYEETFAEINGLAAQRHLMTYEEFQSVYHNDEVRKFYAHDRAGRLIGMATLTNNLAAWPLISPPYFARRWPHSHKRQAIWYCGFVGARPGQLHAFRDLVTDMYDLIRSNNGMAVMDFCTHNLITRRLPDATLALLSRLDPTTRMEVADQQTFIFYRFGTVDGPRP
ncbi:hypothetical protein [Nucisporomicrobium flavum]|uniref:hypothetical protein n=1 Tax=Nucisporomicrobium flavum TaxID=2785915 RepID=UPI0018F434E1|nr:hypothetical protein [Nucisporomicrobium flavum]